MDIALLVVYGFAGMLVWKQRSTSAITAATVGAQIGLAVLSSKNSQPTHSKNSEPSPKNAKR
jgi:hypothetical protein